MEHDHSGESLSSSSDEIRDAALALREPFPVRLTGYMVDFCAYIEKESLKLCQEWIRNTADPDFAGNQFGSDKLQLDIAAVTALIEDGVRRGELKKNAPVELLSHTLVDGMTGGYNTYRTSETPQLIQYYFKQTDPEKGYFGINAVIPKGNQDPVDFVAKDLKLTSFGDVPPANIFPDFQTALKETPDGKNFIYCFYDHKSTVITKTTQDGVPVLSIEGNAEKLYQSIGCTVGFPLTNSGKLTVKFTAKSAGGAKQMFVLVRDNFWKNGAAQKNFTLTNEWADYTFEVDCAKSMKEGIVLGAADCRFGQGVYLFKDFSITWTK